MARVTRPILSSVFFDSLRQELITVESQCVLVFGVVAPADSKGASNHVLNLVYRDAASGRNALITTDRGIRIDKKCLKLLLAVAVADQEYPVAPN